MLGLILLLGNEHAPRNRPSNDILAINTKGCIIGKVTRLLGKHRVKVRTHWQWHRGYNQYNFHWLEYITYFLMNKVNNIS